MHHEKNFNTGWVPENQLITKELDKRYQSALSEVLEFIEGRRQELETSTILLFIALEEKNQHLRSLGKEVKYTFLTTQGVPVSWLLLGVYDAMKQGIPDSNVLGIVTYSRTEELIFETGHLEELRKILHIGQPDTFTFFIDESESTGKTRRACFQLARMLGGDTGQEGGNYGSAVLFQRRGEVAPWDWQPWSEKYGRYYPVDSSRFFSMTPYLSLVRSDQENKGDVHVAEPPVLNTNPQSQVCVSHIARALYNIGFSAAKNYL